MLCQFRDQAKGNRYRCPHCGTTVPRDAEAIGARLKPITPDRQVVPGSEGVSLRAGDRMVTPRRANLAAVHRRQYEGRVRDDV